MQLQWHRQSKKGLAFYLWLLFEEGLSQISKGEIKKKAYGEDLMSHKRVMNNCGLHHLRAMKRFHLKGDTFKLDD